MSIEQPPQSADGIDSNPVEVSRWNRRAFAVWLGAGLSGFGGWRWLRTRSTDGDIPWPLRAAHRFNEEIGRAGFSSTRLAPEHSPALAAEPKVNGRVGRPVAGAAIAPIRVLQPGQALRLFSPIDLVADLPRVEMTTEFMCIEGWSQIVTWGGVRFADFVANLGSGAERHPYVALSTADGSYAVGLDTPSTLHPQTLLCDRMNGKPLSADHGGPLRLVIPVKYGIKNIKWLSRIQFQEERPADYWAERGYDWFSGL